MSFPYISRNKCCATILPSSMQPRPSSSFHASTKGSEDTRRMWKNEANATLVSMLQPAACSSEWTAAWMAGKKEVTRQATCSLKKMKVPRCAGIGNQFTLAYFKRHPCVTLGTSEHKLKALWISVLDKFNVFLENAGDYWRHGVIRCKVTQHQL